MFEDIQITIEHEGNYPADDRYTVEYSDELGNYVLHDVSFVPVTPYVTHVYHDRDYLGCIATYDDDDFNTRLRELIEAAF